MKNCTVSLLFACCFIFGTLPHYSLRSAYAEEVNNPFLVPDKIVLPSGTTIYLSYLAALKDAQTHQKVGILVFFCDDPDQYVGEEGLWNDLIEEGAYIPKSLSQEINIVVMKKGMVKPSEFYPKMDPIIFHMIDFMERFPTLDLSQPSVILISVDEDGKDSLQEVREFKIH